MSGIGFERRQVADDIHRRLVSGRRRKNRARRMALSAIWSFGFVVIGGAKRSVDFCLSLLLIIVTFPIWFIVLASEARDRDWFEPCALGVGRQTFQNILLDRREPLRENAVGAPLAGALQYLAGRYVLRRPSRRSSR